MSQVTFLGWIYSVAKLLIMIILGFHLGRGLFYCVKNYELELKRHAVEEIEND